MSWKFVDSQRAVQGAQLPTSTLRFQAEFEWEGNEEIEVTSMRLNASMPELTGVSWPESAVPFGGRALTSHQSMYVNLALPVDRRFIEAVENWRLSRNAPVRVQGYMDISYRKVGQVEIQLPPNVRPNGRERLILRDLGNFAGQQVQFSISTQRDQWLEALKGLGWNEFEVFEMAVRPVKRHERFQKAFGLLGAAQTALRQGQWSTAVTDARKAVEAAATVVAPDADRRAKFEALVKEVIPGEHDGAKRETLAGLLFALKELRDEAAHAHNLNAQVEREDAELAFSVAVSVFRYIGDALGRRER